MGRVRTSTIRTSRNENGMIRTEGLSKRIGEEARAKKRTPAGRNRAAFLAVREEIRSALDDGWPIKAIWTTLRKEGAIEFGYDAFIRYVDRLISSAAPEPTPVVKRQSEAADKGSVEARIGDAPIRKQTNAIAGFNFQPSLKKEDLI
jgi:hypothetical protein